MSFNLGIELDEKRVCAALEREGTIRMVSFEKQRSMPLALHVARDGTISAGHAAVAAGAADPVGTVERLLSWFDEPNSVVINGFAITGETLLAHLLAAVLDTARSQADNEPLGVVVLAHPAGWSAARRAVLRSAVSQAGAADVETVPATRAVERAPRDARHLPEQAAALGAAAVAASRGRGASSPNAGRPPARPAPPRPTAAPTSVFDATDPTRPRPPVGASNAGDGGRRGGGAPPPVAGDRNGPSRLPFAIVVGVLVALLAVLGVVLANRDDDTSTTTASGPSGPSGSGGTPIGPTSSVGPTTNPRPTSTTTTTATPTTTTTRQPSTTASSTTTTIVVPSRIGPVALADNGLILRFGSSDSSVVRFGEDADAVLTALRGVAGEPASDTGWRVVELCDGDETRRVIFGDLEVVFTKSAVGAPSGTRTFQQWFVDEPGKRPDGLVTLDRVGIGSTVAHLRDVYGSGLKIVQPIPGDPAGLFTTSSNTTAIDGITSGTADRSFVRQMWAGTACQRVAD